MKRFFSVVLVTVMVFCFVSCKNGENNNGESMENSESITASSEITESEPELPEDVQSLGLSLVVSIDHFLDGKISADELTDALNDGELKLKDFQSQYEGTDFETKIFTIKYSAEQARISATGYYLEDPNYTKEDILTFRNSIAYDCGGEFRTS